MCFRTFNKLFNCKELVQRKGTHHNALDDAIYQAECVIASGHGYRHDFTNEDHKRLLKSIKGAKGMVVLSGYENQIYEKSLKKWKTRQADFRTQKKTLKTETLWLNQHASKQSKQLELSLGIKGD